MKRLSIVFTCDSEPIGLYEIERRLRTAGFKRPQAGSIMDAEQSDELAEAYEQGKQAVFDAMNHFDELAIVEWHGKGVPPEETARSLRIPIDEVKAIILQAHPAPAPEKPAGIGDNRRES